MQENCENTSHEVFTNNNINQDASFWYSYANINYMSIELLYFSGIKLSVMGC